MAGGPGVQPYNNVSVVERDAYLRRLLGVGAVTSQDSGQLLPTIGFCADIRDLNTQDALFMTGLVMICS
jgi:hypothetical protein